MPGTQFRELRDLGGRITEVLSEIAELVPNQRFIIYGSDQVTSTQSKCLRSVHKELRWQKKTTGIKPR